MKIINDKYYNLEIENEPNKLGYAAYHSDTNTITLDGEFDLEELKAIIEYMESIK